MGAANLIAGVRVGLYSRRDFDLKLDVELAGRFFSPRITRNTRIVFVYSVWFAVTVPHAVALPDLTSSRERFDRRFFDYAELVAEPDRSTEPPFALGTGALEFRTFDKSGLGGR